MIAFTEIRRLSWAKLAGTTVVVLDSLPEFGCCSVSIGGVPLSGVYAVKISTGLTTAPGFTIDEKVIACGDHEYVELVLPDKICHDEPVEELPATLIRAERLLGRTGKGAERPREQVSGYG